MSEQGSERGAVEEQSGVADSAEAHDQPASPSSTPGGEPSRVDGAAEQAAGVDDESSDTAD